MDDTILPVAPDGQAFVAEERACDRAAAEVWRESIHYTLTSALA